MRLDLDSNTKMESDLKGPFALVQPLRLQSFNRISLATKQTFVVSTKQVTGKTLDKTSV